MNMVVPGSAASETRFAWTVLNERLHPIDPILRGKQCRERLSFHLQASLQIDIHAAIDHSLGGLHCNARASSELGSPLHRSSEYFIGRYDHVYQANCERLLRIDESAGEDEILGLGHTNEARQALCAAGSGDQSEQHLGLTQPRIVCSHSEIAREGQLAAAAQCETCDRGNCRLRQTSDCGEGFLEGAARR